MVPDAVNEVDENIFSCFHKSFLSDGTRQQRSPCLFVFLITSCKDTQERGLLELRQEMAALEDKWV